MGFRGVLRGGLARGVGICLLAACGDDRGMAEDGGVPPADAARDGGGGGTDASAPPDGGGGTDGGTPLDAGGGGDAALCGPGGSWTCGPVECHDDEACVAYDLELLEVGGWTECGTGSFTDADSQMACMMGPPFGDWPLEFRCGLAAFEGSLRFFCAPGGREVLTRYQVRGRMPMGMTPTSLYTSWGTDYWEGSGGGSGTGHLHIDDTTLGERQIAFVGYHRTEIPETGNITSTVWFHVNPYFPGPGETTTIGGGYSVTLGPTGPAGP
jgi:hypothetical protein